MNADQIPKVVPACGRHVCSWQKLIIAIRESLGYGEALRRHTLGKNLVDAGVPLDRVASLLGHESVDTTRIYTTPSEQDLQREVEKVAMV
jgi:integrase